MPFFQKTFSLRWQLIQYKDFAEVSQFEVQVVFSKWVFQRARSGSEYDTLALLLQQALQKA